MPSITMETAVLTGVGDVDQDETGVNEVDGRSTAGNRGARKGINE